MKHSMNMPSKSLKIHVPQYKPYNTSMVLLCDVFFLQSPVIPHRYHDLHTVSNGGSIPGFPSKKTHRRVSTQANIQVRWELGKG